MPAHRARRKHPMRRVASAGATTQSGLLMGSSTRPTTRASSVAGGRRIPVGRPFGPATGSCRFPHERLNPYMKIS